MKCIAACLAAAAVLLIGAQPAAAASAPTVQTRAQADAFQHWLSEVTLWSQDYASLSHQRATTLAWLMDSTAVLTEKIEADGEAAAWADAWALETRKRLSDELDVYMDLPRTLPPPPPLSMPVDGAQRERMEMLSLIPDRTGAMMISTGAASETYIQLVEAAAKGEREPLERLGSGVYVLLIATVEAEITMQEGLLGPRTDPAHHWRKAIIESDRAMILWMQLARARSFDEPMDREAVVAGMRLHTAQMRTSADETTRISNASVREIQRTPQLMRTEMGPLLISVHGSILRSVEIEHRIADILDVLGETLLSDDEAAEEAVEEQLYRLLDERIEEDVARRQILAGAQA